MLIPIATKIESAPHLCLQVDSTLYEIPLIDKQLNPLTEDWLQFNQ